MGQVSTAAAFDAFFAEARAGHDRVAPADLAAEMAAGPDLVVDTRPAEQRQRDGDLPGAVVMDRNVLEWRLDPTSPNHIPEADDLRPPGHRRMQRGFPRSLAAATLRRLGLRRATDLAGGYQAWRPRLPSPRPTHDDLMGTNEHRPRAAGP